MKVIVLILCLSLAAFINADEERPDCRISATPEFSMKYGDTFTISEACLLVKCRGHQTFEIVPSCHTILKGAPSDVAVKKSKEMGDKILAGDACQAVRVLDTA